MVSTYIILENKDSYTLKDGKLDEKLEELEMVSLKKRSNDNNNEIKLIFNNRNRPKNTMKMPSSNSKRSIQIHNTTNIEYVPFDSKLVSYNSPILNYYTINVYLSEDIVEKVKDLPNVTECFESFELKRQRVDPNEFNSNFFYDKNQILKETGWKNVSVQEVRTNIHNHKNSHLSLISQSKFREENTEEYDSNYYYPSTAEKELIYILLMTD